MTNVKIGEIRYNAQNQCFEARVDIVRGDSTFRYPCQLPSPLTAPMGDVRRALKSQALRMSDSSPTLMSSL